MTDMWKDTTLPQQAGMFGGPVSLSLDLPRLSILVSRGPVSALAPVTEDAVLCPETMARQSLRNVRRSGWWFSCEALGIHAEDLALSPDCPPEEAKAAAIAILEARGVDVPSSARPGRTQLEAYEL